MQPHATKITELYASLTRGEDLAALGEILVEGWVRTNRDSGSIGFISLNDGTCFKCVQVVYDDKLANHDVVAHLLTGAAIGVKGHIVLTPEMKQPFELRANEIVVIGEVEGDYPLQKKRHSFEYLREIAYLRPRTNTFAALYRVRSVLALGIHEFFQSRGFVYVHTPEITGNDAEGAGQTFTITTLDDKGKPSETDFYGRKASLTVSGQLHVEPFALAFHDVYTFGPTFRAEKSNTTRHAVVGEYFPLPTELHGIGFG